MALELGSAYVTLIPSARGFGAKARALVNREMGGAGAEVGKKYAKEFVDSSASGMKGLPDSVKRGTSKAASAAEDGGSAAGRRFGSGFAAAAKVGIAAGVAAATAGAAVVAKDAIRLASEAEQGAGAAQAIYKKHFSTIQAEGKRAWQEIGMSEADYLNNSAKNGAFLKNKGLAGAKLAKQNADDMRLAADLAAQYGGTTSEALDAVMSARKGETDPIERYGISLNQAALEREALTKGIADGKKELTDEQKFLATNSILLTQSADARGAAAREMDTYAGAQQRAAAAGENLKQAIGQMVLPVLTNVMKALQTTVIPAMQGFVQGMTDGTGAGGRFMDILKGIAPFIGPLAAGIGAVAGVLGAYKLAAMGAEFATRLFSGALRVSPLGVIITLIGAAVAALVWLYQNNDTARDRMNAAWSSIKDVVTTAWEQHIKPAIDAFVTFMRDVVIPVMQRLWETAQPVFQQLGDWIATTWSTRILPALEALWTWITTKVAPAISQFWTEHAQPALAAFGAFVASTWEQKVRPALEALWVFIRDTLAPAISQFWTEYAQPALAAFGDFVSVTWEQKVRPALEALWVFIRDTLAPAISQFWTEYAQPALAAFGDFVSVTWEQKVRPALEALWVFIRDTLAPAISTLWRDVIQPAFQNIGEFVRVTWETVLKPVLGFLWSFLKNVIIPIIMFLWQGVVEPAFKFIGDIISIAWNTVIKPILWLLWQFIKFVVAPIVIFLWKTVIEPAFKAIGDVISWAWNSVIRPVLDALADAMEKLPSFFEHATEVIKKVWDGLRKIALKPVEFVVQTVINKGLIAGINTIGNQFGVNIPDIPWKVKLAAGGRVPGWSPSDTADNIPALLTADEFVTRQRSARSMRKKHPGVLEYINDHGELPAYASGGQVFDSERPGKYMGGRTSPLGRGEYQQDRGVWRQMQTWLKKNIPGARVTSSFRQTRTATGRISNHARGLALDIVGSGATSMMDIFNAISGTFGSRSIELIHSPAGGRQLYRGRPHNYSGVTRSNHFDHVHWSMQGMDKSIPADFSGGGGFNPFDAAVQKARGVLKGLPYADTFVGKLATGMSTKLIDGASSWLANKLSVPGLGGSDSGGVERVSAGPIRSMVQQLAGQKGWGSGSQWDALQWIIQKESGWKPTAQNPKSTAYGLFQFLNGTWAGTGYRKSSDPQTQTMAGLKYIQQRYGDPANAMSFWKRNGHYAEGGRVTPTLYDTGGVLPPGLTLVSNQTNKPEMIRTFEQERELQDTLASRGGDTINITGVKYDAVPDLVSELEFARTRLRNRSRFGG